MFKELKQKGSDSGCNPYKEIDDDEEHIGCARNLEPKGCWVHDGGDGPPGEKVLKESERMCKLMLCEVTFVYRTLCIPMRSSTADDFCVIYSAGKFVFE